MEWFVKRISIPVYDLEESFEFYNLILNNDKARNADFKSHKEIFVEGGNCQLRLYRSNSFFSSNVENKSRRTYISIYIKNLNSLVKQLVMNEVPYYKSFYSDKEFSIFIEEPSFNIIELFNYDKNYFNKSKSSNANWEFHHINLESYDVRSSAGFIKRFLKFSEGNWKLPDTKGKVNISKKQLALFSYKLNYGGLHINKADLTFSKRNNFLHNPTIGGHPAFSVKNIKKFICKLNKLKIEFTDAKIYALPDVHQLYLYDPNANIIEVNQIINNS